jgi:hypothetical protein
MAANVPANTVVAVATKSGEPALVVSFANAGTNAPFSAHKAAKSKPACS